MKTLCLGWPAPGTPGAPRDPSLSKGPMTYVDSATRRTADSSAAVDSPRRALPRRAAWLAAGAVLALTRDGKPLGIGDFGPTQVVFPRSEREDLAAMPDDWWVWQIYHVAVN